MIQKPNKYSGSHFKESLVGFAFVFPFVLLAGIFMLYPMARGLYNSLFDFRFGGMEFVRLNNYAKVFSDDIYILAIRNTLLFVAVVVPLLIVLSLWISGSIFDKSAGYVSFVRICLYIPVIASAAVMSIIWRFLLDSQTGLARYFFDLIGVPPFNVLGDPIWSRIIVMLVLISVNIGQCVVLYVAAMIGIPKELFEALEIDGGNRVQMYTKILIPLTKPTTLLQLITQTAGIIKVFVLIQLLTNGGPNHQTTTMMYLLYQEGFLNGNFGMASALGVLMFIASILLVFIQFRVIRASK